ncbi:unnamed protein product [Boreogadus saida]
MREERQKDGFRLGGAEWSDGDLSPAVRAAAAALVPASLMLRSSDVSARRAPVNPGFSGRAGCQHVAKSGCINT